MKTDLLAENNFNEIRAPAPTLMPTQRLDQLQEISTIQEEIDTLHWHEKLLKNKTQPSDEEAL